jgi:hypothetical protein
MVTYGSPWKGKQGKKGKSAQREYYDGQGEREKV